MEQITPEKARRILFENGVDISLEQATAILEILSKLADITIDIYFSDNDDPLTTKNSQQ